jgi:hypothetical protein
VELKSRDREHRRRAMFDEKCYELAEHFLPADADEEAKEALAQAIQTFIEDWTNVDVDEDKAPKEKEKDV